MSWAVLPGRKGRRRWGGSPALGKGQFASGMGRGRVDGSCCASVLGAPLGVRELLENEPNHHAKCYALILSLEHAQNTHPEAGGSSPQGMTTYKCAWHRTKAYLLFHSRTSTNNFVGQAFFTWSLISPLETEDRLTCLQVTQLKRGGIAISSRFV